MARQAPQAPTSLEAAELDRSFTADLILRHLLSLVEFRMSDLAERIKLPASLVESVMEEFRRDKLIEIKAAANYSSMSYLFRLTDAGRVRAQEARALCHYAGPAPVSLDDYCRVVQQQTVRDLALTDRLLQEALSGLVVREGVRRRLGPALISGHAVLIYGPSGNGKTSIAEALGRMLPEQVYLPYAVTVGGQIISIYDPVNHGVMEQPEEAGRDARWVLVRRPVISAGGELTLKMLDLNFDPVAKFYDASLQMKANNGLFILDDFGRQLVDPVSILNRWIVPLERRIDHMTLHTGKKFVIPFDVLALFSTELEPRELVHDAFLRRLRYKIRIDRPGDDEFVAIFQGACRESGLEFREEALAYLMAEAYEKRQVQRNACHPRDIIDLVLTRARYHGETPSLDLESMRAACLDYFGEH